jgi:hypothetical protein
MKKLAAAVVAATLMFALVGPAQAGSAHDTKVTMKAGVFDPGPSEFVWSGEVKSDKQGCVTDRKVFLRNENDMGPLGSDRAKENGKWEVRLGQDGLVGDYYAQVKRLDRPGYSCKADKSPKKPLEPLKT